MTLIKVIVQELTELGFDIRHHTVPDITTDSTGGFTSMKIFLDDPTLLAKILNFLNNDSP